MNMDMVVDINFRSIEEWRDSMKRVEHVIDRMRLRGIFTRQIKEAVQKGSKRLRQDGSIVSEYRWFKVIYREFIIQNIKKIYPITVIGV